MIPSDDLRLGLAALRRGLIGADAFAELCDTLGRDDAPAGLADALLERGIVDMDTLLDLRAEVDQAAADEPGLPPGEAETLATPVVSADERRPDTAATLRPGSTTLSALPALALDADRFERRYEMGEPIGHGGVGQVISVADHLMGRTVALKMLSDPAAPRQAIRRFLREARTTARLEHPNIVPVYDLGTMPDGRAYFSMKRVRGRSLEAILRAIQSGDDATLAGTYDLFRLLRIFGQVCMAVDYAHACGVIHRDLKPANVMVGDFGEVLLMDWGIAKVMADDSGDPEPPGRLDPGESTSEWPVTVAGTIFGTPGYMSPEQARGEGNQSDPRSDVWSLGAILYELLTGHRPFERPTTLATLMATIEEEPLAPSRRAPHRVVPPDLEEICLRALSRNPEDRYPSARALYEDLDRYQAGTRELERRKREAAQLVLEGRETLRYLQMLAGELDAIRERLQKSAPLTGHEPLQQKRERWALEDRAARVGAEVRRVFGWAESKLMRAVELDPAQSDARRHLAEMHWERYRHAREAHEPEIAQRHLESVARWDDRSFAHRLTGLVPLDLDSDPPGAEVKLFRYVERDRVLVPEDGHVIGHTPLRGFPLPTGRHLLELRMPDQAPVRLPAMAWQGDELHLSVPLAAAGALGGDLVLVPRGAYMRGNDPDAVLARPAGRVWVESFAIGRYPVTCAEYAAFLNTLPAEEAHRRVPRESAPCWTPDADGRYGLPHRDPDGHEWQPDWPVLGVSFEDAEAYCAWRSAREGRLYRLPTEDEWEKSARGTDGRYFPWGDHFDPTFCCMRASMPGALSPQPVGRFPTDESPYGVRDLAGGVREWTSGDFEAGQRTVRGGAWNLHAFLCRAASRWGQYPTTTLSSIGFRVVMALSA